MSALDLLKRKDYIYPDNLLVLVLGANCDYNRSVSSNDRSV